MWARRSIVLVAVAGCGTSDPLPPPMKTRPMDEGGDSSGASDGVAPPVPGEATDRCSLAPEVGEGRHFGSLRGAFSELAGACGRGGPDTFFRVATPYDTDVFVQAFGVGFTPRVGVIADCTDRWVDRPLGCTEGVGEWILGVAGGTRLVVSVGADVEEPQLQLPAPGEGEDPLRFALDVDFRRVLVRGDRCEPATRGRCAPGLVCSSQDSPTGDEPAVCTVVDADTCAHPQSLSLPFGTTAVLIPRAIVHTDAHAHSCGGGHRPERVYAVTVPRSASAREITVSTRSAALGLAIRAPSCLATDELDCHAPGPAGGTVMVELAADANDAIFLFVELPPRPIEAAPGEEAPFAFDVTVIEAGRR